MLGAFTTVPVVSEMLGLRRVECQFCLQLPIDSHAAMIIQSLFPVPLDFRKLWRMTSLFTRSKPVVGVIHVGALPGTPRSSQTVAELVASAREEAKIYRECGVDGVIIENMHDVPYLRGEVGPEIVAAMTAIATEVKNECRLPVGIQILAGANIEAMAVAHAAGLDFIRAEGYAYAHVADEGLIQASAAKLLRYRRMIGAERVQVWTDVKKKHSAHAITADVSLRRNRGDC